MDVLSLLLLLLLLLTAIHFYRCVLFVALEAESVVLAVDVAVAILVVKQLS
jgi:hypothetical protein